MSAATVAPSSQTVERRLSRESRGQSPSAYEQNDYKKKKKKKMMFAVLSFISIQLIYVWVKRSSLACQTSILYDFLPLFSLYNGAQFVSSANALFHFRPKWPLIR